MIWVVVDNYFYKKKVSYYYGGLSQTLNLFMEYGQIVQSDITKKNFDKCFYLLVIDLSIEDIINTLLKNYFVEIK